jgi:archaellum component FlaF (FlaF/FlaG flagellin family)
MLMAMVYVILGISSILDRNADIGDALTKRSEADDDTLKTSIDITALSLVSDNTIINAVLVNDGNTKLWEYSKFTVIATYDANMTGTRVKTTEQMSYGGISSSPAPGQWVMYSFDPSTDSYVDPQIVNPGEQFTIRIKPQNPIYATSPSVHVTVSTPNGVVASKGGTF